MSKEFKNFSMENWINKDFQTVENCSHSDFKLTFENIPPPHYELENLQILCTACIGLLLI